MICVGIMRDWNLNFVGKYGLVDEAIVFVPSILPQWVQERMAVLRLVEQQMASPIGFWYTTDDGRNIVYRLATTKEEQEEWFRWKKEVNW